jgi:hypothetical protein
MVYDIEYMQEIPQGYVTGKIRPHVKNIKVGTVLKFEPADYFGIPMRHFHNMLASVMGSEYGYHNMRTLLDQHSGIIETVRLA